MTGANLLGIPATTLPAEPEVLDDLSHRPQTEEALGAIVAKHPASSLAWAELAQAAHAAGGTLRSYAYARVGYHRGLDALRKAGWRGQGPVPWEHEPNRGVLRAFWALRRSAGEIDEPGEAERLTRLLDDADPSAAAQIQEEWGA